MKTSENLTIKVLAWVNTGFALLFLAFNLSFKAFSRNANESSWVLDALFQIGFVILMLMSACGLLAAVTHMFTAKKKNWLAVLMNQACLCLLLAILMSVKIDIR